jgi:hypothetical protein
MDLTIKEFAEKQLTLIEAEKQADIEQVSFLQSLNEIKGSMCLLWRWQSCMASIHRKSFKSLA